MLKKVNELKKFNDFKVLAKDYKDSKLSILIRANNELHVVSGSNFEIED